MTSTAHGGASGTESNWCGHPARRRGPPFAEHRTASPTCSLCAVCRRDVQGPIRRATRSIPKDSAPLRFDFPSPCPLAQNDPTIHGGFRSSDLLIPCLAAQILQPGRDRRRPVDIYFHSMVGSILMPIVPVFTSFAGSPRDRGVPPLIGFWRGIILYRALFRSYYVCLLDTHSREEVVLGVVLGCSFAPPPGEGICRAMRAPDPWCQFLQVSLFHQPIAHADVVERIIGRRTPVEALFSVVSEGPERLP